MSVRDKIAKAIADRIRVWHASPHDFDKVDLSKIGTGQGAQSYGPGFYAAESKAVSGQGGEYWKEFLHHDSIPRDQFTAAKFLERAAFDRAEAIRLLDAEIAQNAKYPTTNSFAPRQKMFEEARAALEGGGQVGPRVYEMDIKARPEQFLQWDEPLKNQPEVYKRLDIGGALYPVKNRQGLNPEDATGRAWFQRAAEGGSTWSQDPYPRGWAAMKMLEREGIPGIRYLDQKSRFLPSELAEARQAAETAERVKAGEKIWPPQSLPRAGGTWADEVKRLEALSPTYNYVVNDPDKLEILAKYGIGAATTLPPAIGALAASDQYEVSQ